MQSQPGESACLIISRQASRQAGAVITRLPFLRRHRPYLLDLELSEGGVEAGETVPQLSLYAYPRLMAGRLYFYPGCFLPEARPEVLFKPPRDGLEGVELPEDGSFESLFLFFP